MKTFTIFAAVLLVWLPLNSSFGQHTIWHSPLTFTTDNPNLTITQATPSSTIRVTTAATGDLQWIDLGLVLPSNVRIDSVILYYELSSSSSFISQIRLDKTSYTDAAWVHHDDPTDLTDLGPSKYVSWVEGALPEGVIPTATITLSLRLNFGSTSDRIDIGGIGIVVSPLSTPVQSLEKSEIPDDFSLKQNYPNPFNPNTIIEYDIQRNGAARIDIYNSLGQHVRNLIDEEKLVGSYQVVWDGKDDNGQKLSSGTYFYKLRVEDFVGTKRMILLK